MRVLVAGGGIAGVSAAVAARRSGAEVTLLEQSDSLGTDHSLLPRLLSGARPSQDPGPVCGEEMEELGVRVRLRERLLGVDPVAKTVRTADERLGFDSLVLATGSRPQEVRMRGVSKEGVFLMRTQEDYLALSGSGAPPSHAAVVGSAPLSLLIADALSAVTRTRVFLGEGGMSRLAPGIRAFLWQAASRRGVELLEAGVDAVVGARRAEAVISSGRVFPSDCVVVVPRRDPALPELGCATGVHGGVLVDRSMRTSAEDIFAAGDCSELKFGVVSLSPRLRSSSVLMGRVAGVNAAGGVARGNLSFCMPLNLFGVELLTAGMDLEDATRAGFDAVQIDSDPEELLDRGRIYASIIYDRRTRRVLGLQAAGSDTLASCGYVSLAIASEATLEELACSEYPEIPSAGEGRPPIGLTAGEAIARAQERAFEAQGTRVRHG